MYGKLVCLFQVDKIAIAKVECFMECFRDIETGIDFICTTSSTETAILTLADLTSPLVAGIDEENIWFLSRQKRGFMWQEEHFKL